MSKKVNFTVWMMVLVLLLGVLVSCQNTSFEDGEANTQPVTSAEASETVPQTDADELIPESKPKNMDSSNSNVIIDASKENVQLRFRNDGTGLLIGSVFVTFDEEKGIFFMDDGREIKLISDKDAEVDGEPYTYAIMNYTDEERYFFDSEADEKQIRISKRDKAIQMVVHLAFNYAMNEEMLAMDFDYKFYGKDAELYSAEYSIDDYRGTMQIGDCEFDYSDGDVVSCLLSSTKSSDSYWLYTARKGKMTSSCELEVIEEGKSFVVKNGEDNVNIILINESQAEVDGTLFDYEVREQNDMIEVFSKDSKVSYNLYFFDSDILPPGVMINYEFEYAFDGSELKISFGNLLDNVIGIYNSKDNVMIIDHNKYSLVGSIPSTDRK